MEHSTTMSNVDDANEINEMFFDNNLEMYEDLNDTVTSITRNPVFQPAIGSILVISICYH